MKIDGHGERTRRIVCPALDGLELVLARFSTHRFPLHAHAEMVIGAVLHGAKRSRVGLKDVDVGPGMLTLFNPYEEHTSVGITGDWTFIGFYPPAGLVARCFADGGQDPGSLRLSNTVCADEGGAAQIRRLAGALHAAETPLAVESAFVEAMAYFFTRHGTLPSANAATEEPGIRRARAMLDRHLSGEIGLAELARVAGLPKLKLLREFRRAFGCTPHVYSTARRLAAAKRELARGETIADVAVRFGFCDQSHFTRVFRRWTGNSPGQFAAAAA